MQVFEKIKDRILYHSDETKYRYEIGKAVIDECVKDIIKDLGLENNGWISCSERLPDIHEGKTQSEEVYTVVEWEDGEITYSVGWYNKSGKWNEDSKNCKVVAWKPIQLYVQKGE